MSDQPWSVEFNGQQVPVGELPQDVQELLKVYQSWQDELILAKREVFKLEAALRGLGYEIESRMAGTT